MMNISRELIKFEDLSVEFRKMVILTSVEEETIAKRPTKTIHSKNEILLRRIKFFMTTQLNCPIQCYNELILDSSDETVFNNSMLHL